MKITYNGYNKLLNGNKLNQTERRKTPQKVL